MRLTFLKKLIYPLIALAAVILLWYAGAAAINRDYILPPPHSAVSSLFTLLAQTEFWRAAGGTLLRSLISFAAAFVFAVLLASAAALKESVKRLLSPIITILRSLPTISIILVSLIWLKSTTAPMLIAFLIIFPAMYAAILGAIESTDKKLIEMSNVYKVSKYDTVTRLYIPSVLPAMFTACKSNISLNLKIIIASEVLANTTLSMGFEMQYAKLYLLTPLLFAWTIAAVLLSFALESAVSGISKMVIRWK